MDGVELIYKLKNGGAIAENGKEEEFIDRLKNSGMVVFDRESSKYKLVSEAVVADNVEELIVSTTPKVISLGLYVLNDNFIPSLEVKPKQLSIQLNYLGGLESINWAKILKEKRLGDVFDVTITGYGKNKDNEGYLIELPKELEELYYGKSLPVLTFGMSKFGKESKTKELDFRPIRRALIKVKLGVKTTQGVFFNKEELDTAKKTVVFEKTDFYN